MKKETFITILASLFFTCISQSSSAQIGYVNFGIGYALPASVQTIGTTQVGSTRELVTGSYGKGVNFGGTVGYMLNENIGAELAFSYLSGGEYDLSDTVGLTEKTSGSMIRLIPALRFTAGTLVKLYAKVGIVFGISASVDETSSYTYSNYTQFTGDDKYSGNSTIGFMGALGFEDNISANSLFFIEATFIGQTWAPAVDNYSYSISGNGMNMNQSGTVTFVSVVQNNPPNVNGVPTQAPKEYLPFSSVGFNAGVRFVFGGPTMPKIQKGK